VWLFVGDAVTSFAFGLLAWFALPHGVRAGAKAARWNEALRRMRHDKRMHKLFLGQLAISLVFFQVFSTFGIHVTSCGFSPSTYGAIISINGVLIVACELWLTTYTRRFAPTHMMAVGYVLVGVGFSFNAFAHTLPMLVFVMVLFTFGEIISMPVAAAYFAEGVPPEMRGRYMGVLSLTGALGLTFGPSLGLLLHEQSPNWLWAGCAALGVTGAALALRAGRASASEPATECRANVLQRAAAD
jgi:MFS family permease